MSATDTGYNYVVFSVILWMLEKKLRHFFFCQFTIRDRQFFALLPKIAFKKETKQRLVASYTKKATNKQNIHFFWKEHLWPVNSFHFPGLPTACIHTKVGLVATSATKYLMHNLSSVTQGLIWFCHNHNSIMMMIILLL